MNTLEAMLERHSVRRFTDKAVERAKMDQIIKEVKEIQEISGLRIGINVNEPQAFKADKIHYGNFVNAKNYFSIVAKRGMDEKVGYYGERLVLFLQTLGLNTCWVYLTYKKRRASADKKFGEKLYVVIPFGYGQNNGFPHKSKDVRKVSNYEVNSPSWFKAGLEAAIIAPTAMNQQSFYIELKEGNTVALNSFGGVCHKIDMGIVRYHFEQAAKIENFKWEREL